MQQKIEAEKDRRIQSLLQNQMLLSDGSRSSKGSTKIQKPAGGRKRHLAKRKAEKLARRQNRIGT